MNGIKKRKFLIPLMLIIIILIIPTHAFLFFNNDEDIPSKDNVFIAGKILSTPTCLSESPFENLEKKVNVTKEERIELTINGKEWESPGILVELLLGIDKKGFRYFDQIKYSLLSQNYSNTYFNSFNTLNACSNLFYNYYSIMEKVVNNYEKSNIPGVKYLIRFFREVLGSNSILYYAYNYKHYDFVKEKVLNSVYFVVKYTCKFEKKKEKKKVVYYRTYVRKLYKGDEIDCGNGDLIKTQFALVPECNGMDNFQDCYDKIEEEFFDHIEKYNDQLDKVKNSYGKYLGLCYRVETDRMLTDFLLLDYLGINEITIPLSDEDQQTLFSQILRRSIEYEPKEGKYAANKNLRNSNVEFWLKKFINPNGDVDLGGILLFYRELLKDIKYTKPEKYKFFNILSVSDIFIETKEYQMDSFMNSLDKYGLLSKNPFNNDLILVNSQSPNSLASPKLLTDFIVSFTGGESYDVLTKTPTVKNPKDINPFIYYDVISYVFSKKNKCDKGSIINVIENTREIPMIAISLANQKLQSEIDEIERTLNNYNQNKEKILNSYNQIKNICENTKLKQEILTIDSVRESIYLSSSIQTEVSTIPSVLNYCSMIYSNPSPEEARQEIISELDQLYSDLNLLIWSPNFFKKVEDRLRKIKQSPSYFIISNKNLDEELYNLISSYYKDILYYLKNKPKLYKRVITDLSKQGYSIYFKDLNNFIPSKDNFNLEKHIEILYFIITDTKEFLEKAVSSSSQILEKYISLVKDYQSRYEKDAKFLDLPLFNFNYDYYNKMLKCYNSKLDDNVLKQCGLNDCVGLKSNYLQECILKHEQQDISNIISFLKEKDNEVNKKWYDKYSSIKHEIFEGLRDGDLKLDCKEAKEIINKVRKYPNFYTDPPFKTNYVLLQENPFSFPLGNYQKIAQLINQLNNIKCEVTLNYECKVEIPSQTIENGNINAEAIIIFRDTNKNYLKYKYKVDPELARLLDLKREYEFDKDRLVHSISKDINFKLFEIKKEDDKIYLKMSNYLKQLKKYCKVDYEFLKYPTKDKVIPSNDYTVDGNFVVLLALKDYVLELAPKEVEKDTERIKKGKCIYTYTYHINSGKSADINIRILNKPCYLDKIELGITMNNILDVIDADSKKKVNFKTNPFTIIINREVQKDLHYIIDFKDEDSTFNFTRKIEEKKEDEKRKLEEFILKDKEGKQDLQKIRKCNRNQEEITKILALIYNYKYQLKNLDKRFLLNKVIQLTDRSNIRDSARTLINDYNKLLSDYGKLEKEKSNLFLICDYKLDMKPYFKRLEEYKEDFDLFMKNAKEDYNIKKSLLEKLVEKARKYYKLSLKLYRLTKDPYYLEYANKIKKYADLSMPQYNKLTLKEYVEFLEFYNKQNPIIFEELERKAIRDGMSAINKIPNKKIRDYLIKKIKSIKEPIKKIESLFFESDLHTDGTTPYDYAKREEKKNIKKNLDKTLIKFKLRKLEDTIERSRISPSDKKKLLQKIREIKNKLNSNEFSDDDIKQVEVIEKNVKKLEKEQKSSDNKEESDSNTWLYVSVGVGTLLLLSIGGGLGFYYFYYRKKKREGEEDEEEESEEDDDLLGI